MRDIINRICAELPEHYEISLCLENGAAYIEMTDRRSGYWVELQDSADKTIEEQLQEALETALKQP